MQKIDDNHESFSGGGAHLLESIIFHNNGFGNFEQ